MRVRLILLGAVMGCGFQPSTAANQAGDDATVPDAAALDASTVTAVDAKVFHDAPPCADDDNDGVCNAVDDWPCGTKPTAIPTTYALNVGTSHFNLSNISLNNMGTLAVVGHGQDLEIEMHVDATDNGCGQACVDQIEVGWHPDGHRFACIFDQGVGATNVAKDIDATKDTTAQQNDLTVPDSATPKVYELRASIGQRFGCYTKRNPNDTLDWDIGTEPNAIIAKVCVH